MSKIVLYPTEDSMEALFCVNDKEVVFTCLYFDKLKSFFNNLEQMEPELLARFCLMFLAQVTFLYRLLVIWISIENFIVECQNFTRLLIILRNCLLEAIWYQNKIIDFTHPNFTDFNQIVYSELLSYLSPCCEIAAKRRYRKLGQILALKRRYELSDYEQMCWEKLSSPVDFLKNFATDSPYSLKNYTTKSLEYAIRNKIHEENKEIRRLKFSGYRLLNDVSHKEMKYALSNHFYDTQIIDNIYLIWCIFKEICTSENSTGKFVEPTHEDFVAISQRFNERKSPHLLEKTEQQVEKLLKDCIEVISRCLRNQEDYPDSRSFDCTSEHSWGIIFSNNSNIYTDIDNQFENSLLTYLSLAFDYLPSDKKEGLTAEEKALLDLYYGLELNLTYLGCLLRKNQSTASRKRQRAMKKLLNNWIELWNRQESQIFQKDETTLILQAFIPTKKKNQQENQLKKNQLNNENIKFIATGIESYLYRICCQRISQLIFNNTSQTPEVVAEIIESHFIHDLPILLPRNNLELLRQRIFQLIQDFDN
jgi:hypothetical protein